MNSQPSMVIGVPVQRRQSDSPMSIAQAYTDTLVRFGATPLVLPLFETSITARAVGPLLTLCDGFLLTGSVADVHPHRYGGGDVPEGGFCDERRDALDWAILDHADSTSKPVFGICRGCQVMNVYRGGTLAWRYRDILPESTIEHLRSDISNDVAHTVTCLEDSWLASQLPGPVYGVNSLHRQVCSQVASSLRVSAVSEDGLIEAIEDRCFPHRFFGVQWHPELLVEESDSLVNPLFERFIHACAVSRANPLFKF